MYLRKIFICVVFFSAMASFGRATEIAFEAEDATVIQPPFEIREDKEASGGEYIVSPSEGVNAFVEYAVEIGKEGDWIIWGRVIAPNGDQDSFLIVDFDSDVKPAYGDDQFRWGVKNGLTWAWDKVNAVAGDDPRVFHLTEGEHTLKIWNRENSTQLDVIFMTTGANLMEGDIDALLEEALTKKEKAVKPADKLPIIWSKIKAGY